MKLRKRLRRALRARQGGLGLALDAYRARRQLARGRAYFGTHLHSLQGNPRRHGYMQRVVELECSERPSRFYRILEIGSWAGGSAITWAAAIKQYNRGMGQVVCVDPWTPYLSSQRRPASVYGSMDSALVTGEIVSLFLHNIRASGHDDVVRMLRGTSDELLPLLRSGEFDLVFVDGSHERDQVARDLANSAPLLREGGILCGDDLELQASEVDQEFAERNRTEEFVSDPKTGTEYHPGVTLAVAELLGPVSCWEGFWAMRKAGDGWEPLAGERFTAESILVPEHLRSR